MEYIEANQFKALKKKHIYAKKYTYLFFLAENERIKYYSKNRKKIFAQL